ncbi:MAG: 4Fe-4S dicluster domain-containing protein [bacterium]|nr:4Fe-4S dicluster domain-containing protein [bacterium]
MNFTENFNYNPSEITREFYFNVGTERFAIYIGLFLSVSFLLFSIYRRFKVWKKGKGELKIDRPFKRILAVLKYIVLQSKVFKEKAAGIMHGSIFFGFIGLVLVTFILTIQSDITVPIFDHIFLTGNSYLIWSLFADVAGSVVLIGLVIALVRRYIIKPGRLDTRGTDSFALMFLLLVMLSGFLAEALRIAITGMPEFEIFSPVGYALAGLFTGFDNSMLESIHYADWWVHMVSSFAFIGLMGTGKAGHIMMSTLNVFFMNLENESPGTRYGTALIDPGEFETAETFGVSKVEEYTWKQLMDSDACTRCGRCQDNCPAWLTEKPLSPKKLINDIKDTMDGMDEKGPLLVQADEFWSCTNCGACMEACPVCIEHTQKMIDLRRYKVLMEGDMAPELQTTFQNLETNFNPYGFAFGERAAWLESTGAGDLDITLMSENSANNKVDYLYFVGSAASYDKRNQKVAIAFLKIMKAAGLSVGILGPEEADSGDAAMRGGNEYLFHALAAQNLETFKAYGVKKIVCTCPHDYNVIKKEYKKFAAIGTGSNGEKLSYDFEVYHHTELIADLVKKGDIKLKKELHKKVTFHDSCFLGRYNEIYDEPRSILKAIPGIELVEMSRNKDRSFCCGGGGARMFIEEHLGSRINQFRTLDAESSGAAVICTACPFCMTMLSDGAVELEIEELKTVDVAEIVLESMEV